MNKSLLLLVSVLATIITSSCGLNKSENEVKIGNQIWLAKNLDVDKFNNGNKISEAKSNKEWYTANKNRKPAWCNFDNDRKNGKKYGKLYNWYAVIDPRGITPKGWHIPSKSEWLVLIKNLGGSKIAGNKMKSISGWDLSGNGNNESGFLGLPGGFRFENGEFSNIGSLGNFWSITKHFQPYAEVLNLDYGTSETFFFPPDNGFGISLRCIKD